MSILNLSDVLTFFLFIAMAVIFVAVWMIDSERRRNILKTELKKLRSQIDSHEREKFILLEKISILENTQAQPEQNGWAVNAAESEHQLQEARAMIELLEADNARMKKELSEAKGSLEEVYKALS
jgi:hypothetical protein